MREVNGSRTKISLETNGIRVHRRIGAVYNRPSRPATRPLMFTKESILLDIQRQNFAGKPCHIAQISGGKITYKAHVFHQGK